MKKLWFKRKLFGWGWTPCTWEGWLVLLGWLALVFASVTGLDHEATKNIAVVILLTIILLAICYWKGEKPRWQWGKRIED